MLLIVLLGLTTMVICLSVQMILLILAWRYYSRHMVQVRKRSFWSLLSVFSGVMLILVAGNLAQVAVWAQLFLLLDEFQQFNQAFYHSAVNFATLGYGDIVMSPRHKLLGPMEAINGVLMIGVSTAALMTTFQDAIRRTIEVRNG
jgi:hypothetical protein